MTTTFALTEIAGIGDTLRLLLRANLATAAGAAGAAAVPENADQQAGRPRAHAALEEGLPGGGAEEMSMAEWAEAVRERAEDLYGWCGLCHTFTQFPHECAGRDRPVEDEAA